MTEEASEFLREQMRGDCMAMIEHQEREIADLREQLAEKQEWIEEQEAQISEIQRDRRRQSRELLNDIAWLHSELRGEELEAEKAAEIKAENRRLRSCLEDAAENERLTTHEFNQLKEQRDKLRELVRQLYEFAYEEYPDSTELNFADRMRELGVEI